MKNKLFINLMGEQNNEMKKQNHMVFHEKIWIFLFKLANMLPFTRDY